MASGDTLMILYPQASVAPNSNYATMDLRGTTPHPVLDFALNEKTYFSFVLPRSYAGGGITLYCHYAMSSAEADAIVLEIGFERIGDQLLDIDGPDSFAAAQSTGDVTVPGTSGLVDIATITFTDGAQIDSLAVGECGRIEVERVSATGADAAGDLELLAIEVKET